MTSERRQLAFFCIKFHVKRAIFLPSKYTSTQYTAKLPIANNLSPNINLPKTQLHKLGKSGGFLGRLLALLWKIGLPLIGNVLKPLTKSILIPLGLTAAPAATDAAIHKKMFGSGNTILIVSNEGMNDIMKIIKSLEKSWLLIKGVIETIKNEAKEQKEGFLRMLL